jgi:hypothetical protein
MKRAAVVCLMGLGGRLLLALARAGLLQWRYEALPAETLGVCRLAALVVALVSSWQGG